MGKNYLPDSDSGLVAWTSALAKGLAASPERYSLTPAQCVAYQALQQEFAAAWRRAIDTRTRGLATVCHKNTKRDELTALTRHVVRIVQTTPDLSDADRVGLGLTVRKAVPTDVPIPDEVPKLEIMAVRDRAVKLRVSRGWQHNGIARPAGTIGIFLYTHVGNIPPQRTEDWKFHTSTSQRTPTVEFPHTVPAGSAVWFMARWVNTKLQPGKTSPPVFTHLAGFTLNMAA